MRSISKVCLVWALVVAGVCAATAYRGHKIGGAVKSGRFYEHQEDDSQEGGDEAADETPPSCSPRRDWKKMMKSAKYEDLPAEYRHYEEKFKEFYKAEQKLLHLKGLLKPNPLIKNSSKQLGLVVFEQLQLCLQFKLLEIVRGKILSFPQVCCFLDIFKIVPKCRSLADPIRPTLTPRSSTKKPSSKNRGGDGEDDDDDKKPKTSTTTAEPDGSTAAPSNADDASTKSPHSTKHKGGKKGSGKRTPKKNKPEVEVVTTEKPEED